MIHFVANPPFENAFVYIGDQFTLHLNFFMTHIEMQDVDTAVFCNTCKYDRKQMWLFTSRRSSDMRVAGDLILFVLRKTFVIYSCRNVIRNKLIIILTQLVSLT